MSLLELKQKIENDLKEINKKIKIEENNNKIEILKKDINRLNESRKNDTITKDKLIEILNNNRTEIREIYIVPNPELRGSIGKYYCLCFKCDNYFDDYKNFSKGYLHQYTSEEYCDYCEKIIQIEKEIESLKTVSNT